MASLASIDERVSAFIEEILKVEDIREAFNVFLIHKTDAERFEQWSSQWVSILKDAGSLQSADLPGSSSSTTDSALKSLVTAMGTKRASNPKILSLMMSLLETSVKSHVVTSRQVCDSLLNSDHLRYDKTDFWVSAFKLVRKIIGGVDYKGVREIMKSCIDKLQGLPSSGGIVQSSYNGETLESQMAAIHSLMAYIFDRNAALLPGYFIVNEILKSYPENPLWPHWMLVPMVSAFLNSFRPTAQMVSSLFRHRMRPIVEQTGKAHNVSTWRVDPHSFIFLLKGNLTYDRILPYNKELLEPQKELINYIMRQLYSKELVNSVLGVQKPRKDSAASTALRYPMLEEQLVQLFIQAMEESEIRPDSPSTYLFWWNASSQLIFFLLYQFVNFSSFIDGVSDQVMKKYLKTGRDHLMWALLQFISGSIAKNTTTDFMPVLKMFVLYDEQEPLPIPDIADRHCVIKLSAAGLFIHLSIKAQSNGHLAFKLPTALVRHYEFLQQLLNNDLNVQTSLRQDFLVPLVCNTYSTSQEIFQGPIAAVVKTISGSNDDGAITNDQTINMPGVDCVAPAATEPLSMDVLDAMSVHVKMSLTHNIVALINKQLTNKSQLALAPAVVETYSRLLIYSEIESLGIKGLLNNLLPQVFKQNSWGFLHMLLEIFSYRLHHTQAQFRLTLLSHLQIGLVTGSHSVINKNPQLNVCIESATLKLITGLGNAEITVPKGQTTPGSKPGTVMYGESEELNRVVILSLARAIHINGLEQQSSQWVKEVLSNIMTKTPHSWPPHTLQKFPQIIQDFYADSPGPKENKAQLRKTVEDEFKTWTSMSNEHDIVQHFSNSNNTNFLCVVWKMLLESDTINAVAFKVLERIGAKQLTAHLRSFCDLLVCEFSKTGGSGHVTKCIYSLNHLIWNYQFVALDKLILCMSLRANEGSDAQVAFFIIQLLLLKPLDFRNRVSELVRTMSPEHQLMKDFHMKHMEFHSKFPENFGLNESSSDQVQTLPTYFGNVCLRFIPVFDIVVHRFLELPSILKSLETLIDHVGVLYKFHDRPITYLYNTLHYYETVLRDKVLLKRKLVSNIVGALKDVRPHGWCLTPQYLDFLAIEVTDNQVVLPQWTPGHDYYVKLLGRLVQSVQGKMPFPYMDWRFNEFPNEGAHALYVTSVEIMGLPNLDPVQVGGLLLDVILETHHLIPGQDLPDWFNALGLLLSNLPDIYSEGLTQRLVSALTSPPLSQWTLPQSIFDLLNVEAITDVSGGPTPTTRVVLLLAIAHSYWHHTGFSQVHLLPDLVRDKFVPVVQTEEQLIYVFHMVGPFLQRLHSERYMRPLFDMAVHLYKMLARVDNECAHLHHMDAICDILYHVKYQFTGDSIKVDAEKFVKELRPALQLRLRFISPGTNQPQLLQGKHRLLSETDAGINSLKKPSETSGFTSMMTMPTR